MNALHEQIRNIIDSRVGIPAKVRDSLYAEIVRAIELAHTPQGRREGATIMTQAASLAADQHIQDRKGGKSGDPGAPRPRSL
jgi:hypothetical protein